MQICKLQDVQFYKSSFPICCLENEIKILVPIIGIQEIKEIFGGPKKSKTYDKIRLVQNSRRNYMENKSAYFGALVAVKTCTNSKNYEADSVNK